MEKRNEILTDRQTSEQYGIGLSTLRKARARGWGNYFSGLQFIRVGRSIRYSRRDIEDFLNSKRVCPAAEKADTNAT